MAGRDLFLVADEDGLINKTVESRRQRLKDRDTLIGSSPRELKGRYGVELKPRAIRASGRTCLRGRRRGRSKRGHLGDGLPADYSWIDLPILDSSGRLRHGRGVTDVPGLYFLGLTWQHARLRPESAG